MFTSVEICAGAGGQALGLEQAGFDHVALVEVDSDACKTLRLNRPRWNVLQLDVRDYSGDGQTEVDLLAGGIPCPPFSIAGKQLGQQDERDLFPEVLRLVAQIRPRAIMIENVRGLMGPKFDWYREHVLARLDLLGYRGEWQLLNASDFGVPQLRPRAVLVAALAGIWHSFKWPVPGKRPSGTVGELLWGQMSSRGWRLADQWASQAGSVAPTLVGGSRKHGGPDLGPTRAREAWMKLGVDGKGLADEPPAPGFIGEPRLTVEMAKLLQGFPEDWLIAGGKTSSYRQVGNAFPPPVAREVGTKIKQALALEASVERGDEVEFASPRRAAQIS